MGSVLFHGEEEGDVGSPLGSRGRWHWERLEETVRDWLCPTLWAVQGAGNETFQKD